MRSDGSDRHQILVCEVRRHDLPPLVLLAGTGSLNQFRSGAMATGRVTFAENACDSTVRTRACLPNLRVLTGEDWPVTRMGVISDEFWAAVESLMPSDVGKRGNRFGDRRLMLEGIAWRFRTGSPWRDLPADFGPWQTVWKRHHRWSLDGTYEAMFAQVAAVFGFDAEVVENI